MANIGYMKAHTVTPRMTLFAANNTALEIPNGCNCFIVSGSSLTIPSLSASLRPGRVIWLIGASDSASVTITDTAIASTADGTISLSSGNTLAAGFSIALKQLAAGGWQEVFKAACG